MLWNNIQRYLSEKDEHQPNPIPITDWEYNVTQQHRISIMPPSETQPEYYFHQSIGKPSPCLLGVHTLSDTGTEEVKSYCEEVGIVGDLEWDVWHNFLCVSIDRKIIAFAPIDEAALLQLTGKTSSTSLPLKSKKDVVKFPISLDESDFYSMHQSIDSEGVIYSTEFAAIIFESPSRLLVNYDLYLKN
jgi:hypothetical protein